MLFPDGFTGFRSWDDPAIPDVDLAVFKSVCFAAARVLSGKVVEFTFADVTPNFHSATFEWGYEPSRAILLCNRTHYIVGFCRFPRDGDLNEYVDAPDLASAIGKVSDWQILSKAELEKAIDSAALDLMSQTDREVIEKAWRKGWCGPTRTVGDFLFHYSD